MSNLHRIQWINRQIRAERYPNCTNISKEFCISSRQALRDIEYLRYSLNAEVEFSYKHNGYYYPDDSFFLPSIFLSSKEEQALFYIKDCYSRQSDDFSKVLALLFKKLIGRNKKTTDKEKEKDEPPMIPYKIPYEAILMIDNRSGHTPDIPTNWKYVTKDKYSVSFYYSRPLLVEILQFGSYLKIKSPDWLRNKAISLCNKIIKNNS